MSSNNRTNKEQKDTKKSYHSFDELAQEVFGLPPYTVQSPNASRREDMHKKYDKIHVCKSCNTPMTYMGGNVLACTNKDCTKKGYRLLTDREKRYVQTIF